MRFETLKGGKKKGGQKAALLRTENWSKPLPAARRPSQARVPVPA